MLEGHGSSLQMLLIPFITSLNFCFFIFPIFLMIRSFSIFKRFSAFMKEVVRSFPSSRSLLVSWIVYWSLMMFEVTPTTRTSSPSSLKLLLLMITTGLTFLPDWSEKGKGTRSRSLCLFIDTGSKPRRLSYCPRGSSSIFLRGVASPHSLFYFSRAFPLLGVL